MRRRLGYAIIAALYPALLVFSACATKWPMSVHHKHVPASAESKLLADRDQMLTSLQTAAVMEYVGPNGHVKARERISVRRPASLRVEALSPLGVALVVTADANEVAVFDPAKNTIARGPATAATLDRVARIPFAPQQAVRLLLALAPDATLLSTPPTSSSEENGATTLTYSLDDGSATQLAFGDGDLLLIRELARDGSVVYEVVYSDYRDIGGVRFPSVIAASFPTTTTAIKFSLDQPLVDGPLPDSTFVLAPGPQTKELNLGFNLNRDAARG